MRKFHLKPALFALLAVAACGCVSHTEVATGTNARLLDDGERPIGELYVSNFSYRFLGCIPWCTSESWKTGAYDMDPQSDGMRGPFIWFEDHATMDDQLEGVKHAMKVFSANRVMNLRTTVKESSLWSLGILKRRHIRTYATLLR